VRDTAGKGGRVLFVGTKRQAAEAVAEAAGRCAQYFMNDRWLGGTLTNWATVSNSIKRLRDLDEMLEAGESTGLTKKELLKLQREQVKLQRVLGGIRNMGGLPDLMFVIDTNKESIAVKEARKLGIPVVAIQLYCNLIADAVLDGMSESSMASGEDLGASETVREPALAATAEAEAQA